MPNRVIRAGLLSSESVAALHDRTFRLYLALLLTADDYGLVEIGYGPIREATALLDGWNRELVAKMLGELIDAQLILPYEAGGKRYAAIARWESWVNTKSPKHPLPTWGTSHVRRVLAFKDAQTRAVASSYFKHLGLSSGALAAPSVGHHGPTRPPPVNEVVSSKNEWKKQGSAEGQWVCPGGVDPSAWKDWMQVRRRKKAATSERALTAVMAKIEQARRLGLDPSAIVARSADRGWTDLYLPDPPRPASSQQQLVGEFGLFDTTGAFGGHRNGG